MSGITFDIAEKDDISELVRLKLLEEPEYRKITEFPRGTLYDILQDAYSYDPRN